MISGLILAAPGPSFSPEAGRSDRSLIESCFINRAGREARFQIVKAGAQQDVIS
jgi:hypothetical protein